MAAVLVTSATSCEDFQDINRNPNAVDEESVQIDYLLSRPWNHQQLSRTMASLSMGLGGVTAEQISKLANSALYGIDPADLAAHTQDPNKYLGIRMQNYLPTSTNRFDAGYFFDAIPEVIDPRTMINYTVPGVESSIVMASNYYDCPETIDLPLANKASTESDIKVVPTENPTTVAFPAKYTYHSLLPGDSFEYGSNFTAFTSELSAIANKSAVYRGENGQRRVFFGHWETQFLLAEGALKGWNAGVSAETAYNAGIAASFEYNSISSLYESYVKSESYNRNGTSVSFTHTAEQASADMEFYDFDANLEAAGEGTMAIKANSTMETATYTYPKGAYSTNNDLLTKIITQKYIANCPWLPSEAWADYRRVNLPFMENPIVEKAITNMPWHTKANAGEFNPQNVPQRLRYPSSLKTSNPAAYESAVSILGGDEIGTRFPWAK